MKKSKSKSITEEVFKILGNIYVLMDKYLWVGVYFKFVGDRKLFILLEFGGRVVIKCVRIDFKRV